MISRSASANSRPGTSFELPGRKGTTRRTGRLGTTLARGRGPQAAQRAGRGRFGGKASGWSVHRGAGAACQRRRGGVHPPSHRVHGRDSPGLLRPAGGRVSEIAW
jgi:hypothetical protein